MESVLKGDVWGVIHFPQNFTDEIMVRQADGNSASNATIIGSQIGVKLDWSSTLILSKRTFCMIIIPVVILMLILWLDQQNSLTIQRRLIDAFDDFSDDLLQACAYEKGAGSLPLTVVANLCCWLFVAQYPQFFIYNHFSFLIPFMVIKILRLPSLWRLVLFWRKFFFLFVFLIKIFH